jgi:hypothetical protein
MAHILVGHHAYGLAGCYRGYHSGVRQSAGRVRCYIDVSRQYPSQTATIPVAIYFNIQAGHNDRALILVLIVLVITFASLAALAYWKPKSRNYASATQNE